MNTDKIFTGAVKEAFVKWFDHNTKVSLNPMAALSEKDYTTCMLALMVKWCDSRGYHINFTIHGLGFGWTISNDLMKPIKESNIYYHDREEATASALKALNEMYVIRFK